jgi:hypothetical protein
MDAFKRGFGMVIALYTCLLLTALMQKCAMGVAKLGQLGGAHVTQSK